MTGHGTGSSSDARLERLGRYRLIATLARGGMGDVFVALSDGGLDKLFVVKKLKTEFAADPLFVKMFQEEARIAARLSHPNIVQTIEVGTQDDAHYIAMEYLEGQSFSRVLSRTSKRGQRLPLRVALEVIASILDGLEYLHTFRSLDGSALGMIHRDVTPHNVSIGYDGQVKLLDFGVAKAQIDDASREATRVGVVKGKLGYMPLEQIRGGKVDGRADVFSAGVILWEVLAGRRMWAGAEDVQIVHDLALGQIPDLRELAPHVDEELVRIVARATAPNVAERYPSAGEFQADLEAFAAALPGGGPRERARIVGELFEKERVDTRKLIDGQVKRVQGSPTTLPPIDMARAPLPSSVDDVSLVHAPIAAAASVLPARPRSARRLGTMAAVAALAVLGGTAAFALRPKASPPPPPPPPPPAVAATPAPAPPAVPTQDPTIHLLVSVKPPSAKVFIDDVAAEGSPPARNVARGQTHTVRAEAPGFVTQRAEYAGTADGQVELVLAPVSIAAPTGRPVWTPPSRPAVAAPPSSPPPEAVATAGEKKKPPKGKREIERDDPYAK